MSASILPLLLAAGAPAPQISPCLLVGPSSTTAVVGVDQSRPREIELSKYTGYDWPFGEPFYLTSDESGERFQQKPRKDALVAEFSTLGDSLNVEVYREGGRHKGIPIFSGSCPSSKSSRLRHYLAWLESRLRGDSATYEQITETGLETSLECQMASAGGWISKFALSFDEPKTHFSIDPRDTHIWKTRQSYERLPGFPAPAPTSVVGMIAFKDVSAPSQIGSFNGIWLSASKDRRSMSMRTEFYGYAPEGSTSKEWLSGICSNFVKAGAVAS